jgi:threonine/homoserine/homoserine lactone efflux protein
MPVFFVLGFHLLFLAKPPNPSMPVIPTTMRRQFLRGLVISIFNLLAVPYWFVYCGSLKVEGLWQDGWVFTFLFALGVSFGTLAALSLYAWLGQVVLHRSKDLAKYANRFIGLIFIGLGIKLLWGLLH